MSDIKESDDYKRNKAWQIFYKYNELKRERDTLLSEVTTLKKENQKLRANLQALANTVLETGWALRMTRIELDAVKNK